MPQGSENLQDLLLAEDTGMWASPLHSWPISALNSPRPSFCTCDGPRSSKPQPLCTCHSPSIEPPSVPASPNGLLLPFRASALRSDITSTPSLYLQQPQHLPAGAAAPASSVPVLLPSLKLPSTFIHLVDGLPPPCHPRKLHKDRDQHPLCPGYLAAHSRCSVNTV